MAKLLVFSVRDSALNAFARPFYFPTIPVAKRSFREEVNRADPNNGMHVHTSDFELYLVGTFDEDLGVFSPTETAQPVLVERAIDVKEKPNGS